MNITQRSLFTGKEHTMDLPVTDEQFTRWKNGTLIQDAFPNLTASQREFLMTGTTQEEWDAVFGKEEESDVT